jgi:hypothetical protein
MGAIGQYVFIFQHLSNYFMSYFLEQPGLFDRPIRLEPAARREPFRVMEEFFADYRLHEWRHHLWNIIETCLGTDNDAFAEPGERADLLQHYRDLEELLEAVWLLVERRETEPAMGDRKREPVKGRGKRAPARGGRKTAAPKGGWKAEAAKGGWKAEAKLVKP